MSNSRVPPQSIEAEQAILGGLMLDEEAWDLVTDVLNENDFYKPSHRKIFLIIKELHVKKQPSDLVTVSNLLMEKNELAIIGGPSYLAELVNQNSTIAHMGTYANIIRENSVLRRLIHSSGDVIDKAFKKDFESLESFLDGVESEVYNLNASQETTGLISASELVKLSLDKLELLYSRQLDVTGIPSGFVDLDDMTAGFHPGELTIIAARPSMGKTAFSLNLALHAALKEKKHVAYFSVEMAKEQVMMRLLASEAKVDLSALRTGKLNDDSWPKIINTSAKLSEAPLYIDDTAGISPFEIRAKCRRLKTKVGLDMIMIDYLQLMGLKQKVESREREVSEISKMLKGIAKELSIPVIALAQLNRGVEGRTDRRPLLSDLRESGSIEQDADIIMMLYRADYYERDNPEVKGLAEVIIGKQRNGPTGFVKLRWQPELGTFHNHTLEEYGDPTNAPPSSHGPSKASLSPPINKVASGGPKNFAPT